MNTIAEIIAGLERERDYAVEGSFSPELYDDAIAQLRRLEAIEAKGRGKVLDYMLKRDRAGGHCIMVNGEHAGQILSYVSYGGKRVHECATETTDGIEIRIDGAKSKEQAARIFVAALGAIHAE